MWVSQKPVEDFRVFNLGNSNKQFAALRGEDLHEPVVYIGRKNDGKFLYDSWGSAGGDNEFAARHAATAANNAATAAGFGHSNNILAHNQKREIELVKMSVK